jgi:hypothetical protein
MDLDPTTEYALLDEEHYVVDRKAIRPMVIIPTTTTSIWRKLEYSKISTPSLTGAPPIISAATMHIHPIPMPTLRQVMISGSALGKMILRMMVASDAPKAFATFMSVTEVLLPGHCVEKDGENAYADEKDVAK